MTNAVCVRMRVSFVTIAARPTVSVDTVVAPGGSVSCSELPSSEVVTGALAPADGTGTVTRMESAIAPISPSASAVTSTTPGASAVTRPLALTRATATSLEAQVMRRVSAAPPASRGTAASCDVAPTRRMPSAGAPLTSTNATGTGGSVGPESQLSAANSSTAREARPSRITTGRSVR